MACAKPQSLKLMADIITCSRILFSILLLFTKPLSPVFFALYISAGLSDIADGLVARLTHTESERGAKLDSIADFIFVTVCFLRISPVLPVKTWIWYWTGIIATIRIGGIILGRISRKKPLMLHTFLNKLTGIMLFALPFSLGRIDLHFSVILICSVATLATFQEQYLIQTHKGP